MGIERGVFNRTQLLLGSDAMERLSSIKVMNSLKLMITAALKKCTMILQMKVCSLY